MKARRTWMARWAALVIGVFALAGPALAQPVVKVVVGGAPGGLFDIALRLVTPRLERELGATLVIDFKPGAAGAVALAAAKSAKPDGTTLAMVNVGAAANESMASKRAYDLFGDFLPVGLYFYPANVLIANPELGARTVGDLVATLKASKESVNYASGGVGSPGHLAGEMLKIRAGVPIAHIPYKGAPAAILAVVTGESKFMFATASSALGQVTAGKVRALGVTTPVRVSELPEVPTMAEAGLADFHVGDWVGLLAPAGTPPEVVAKAHAAFAAAFGEPEAQAKLRKATFVPAEPALGPAEFGAFLRAEVDKWAALVKQAKIGQ